MRQVVAKHFLVLTKKYENETSLATKNKIIYKELTEVALKELNESFEYFISSNFHNYTHPRYVNSVLLDF
jgi:hypothetical protein